MEDKWKTNPFAKKYKEHLHRNDDKKEALNFVKGKRSAMEKALKRIKK